MNKPSSETLIQTYIQAKDENRPHLMKKAFALDATLEITVKSDAITFPARSEGLAEISAVLVRRFGQTFDNVYTFCLTDARPEPNAEVYGCDWLVGMTDKSSTGVRIGCGRYRWQFCESAVQSLEIVIEAMQVLPLEHSERLLDQWLSTLPYPWCSAAQALESAPEMTELAAVFNYLKR